MYSGTLLGRLAIFLCFLQLSQCSVMEQVLPGSCPVTPSKEKVWCSITSQQCADIAFDIML